MTEVPGGSANIDPRAAKAEAAAAKARAKAVRPWFKKKRVIIPGAILSIVVLSNLGGGGSDDGSSDSATSSGSGSSDSSSEGSVTEASPSAVRIGQSADDGDFSFVVDDYECIGPVLESNNDFIEDVQAQGEWCVLTITVTNKGNDAGLLSGSNQYLVDDQNREFAASDNFDIYLIDETPIFEQINPGNSLTGRIYFDVSDAGSITQAELHDSPFSNGVRVDLK